jgi:8-oxo-dGTP diphosphatase
VARPKRVVAEPSVIQAAGGLVWRAGRLAVIHRPKQRDWSLPKGKLELGETFPDAAVREVAEETGCRARLGDFAGYTLYRVKRRPKLVLFWHMFVAGACRFEPNGEVDRLEWLRPSDALARLDHDVERRLVRSALGTAGARSGSVAA